LEKIITTLSADLSRLLPISNDPDVGEVSKLRIDCSAGFVGSSTEGAGERNREKKERQKKLSEGGFVRSGGQRGKERERLRV